MTGMSSQERPPWPLTGHAEIDRQHALLHALMEHAYVQIGKDGFASDSSALRKAITAFASSSSAHFAFEAGLMERTGFAEAAGHLEEHSAIIEWTVRALPEFQWVCTI